MLQKVIMDKSAIFSDLTRRNACGEGTA